MVEQTQVTQLSSSLPIGLSLGPDWSLLLIMLAQTALRPCSMMRQVHLAELDMTWCRTMICNQMRS